MGWSTSRGRAHRFDCPVCRRGRRNPPCCCTASQVSSCTPHHPCRMMSPSARSRSPPSTCTSGWRSRQRATCAGCPWQAAAASRPPLLPRMPNAHQASTASTAELPPQVARVPLPPDELYELLVNPAECKRVFKSLKVPGLFEFFGQHRCRCTTSAWNVCTVHAVPGGKHGWLPRPSRRLSRSRQDVSHRRVLAEDAHGNRTVEVDQTGSWRFLMFRGSFTVRMIVEQRRADRSVRRAGDLWLWGSVNPLRTSARPSLATRYSRRYTSAWHAAASCGTLTAPGPCSRMTMPLWTGWSTGTTPRPFTACRRAQLGLHSSTALRRASPHPLPCRGGGL